MAASSKTVKKKPKVTEKKVSNPKGDRVREYFESIDFRDWWEEFATACNKNGTLKYPTVWSFIKDHTKDKWKRDFLWWILGPEGTDGGDYKGYTQYKWEERREKGHWYNSANADKLSQDLKSAGNALDAMREVGKVNITFISRLENLLMQLDREYSGRLFLPELDQKENSIRAATYFKLLAQAQEMLGQAQLMFGKTQGIDIQRLSDFYDMFAKGMGQTVATIGLATHKTIEGEKVTPEQAALKQIMATVLKKSEKFDLELPDNEMLDIIKENVGPTLVPAKG